MTMEFKIKQRDGAARIGQITVGKKDVVTPTLLFIHTTRFAAPSFADILISSTTKNIDKPAFFITDNWLTSIQQKQKIEFLIPQLETSEEYNLQSRLFAFIDKEGKVTTYSKEKKTSEANFLIFTCAHQLLQRQTEFCHSILQSRETAGYRRLLYLPSIATPSNIALFTYCGVDCYDSFSAILAARRDKLLFSDGMFDRASLHELPCSCPACSKTTIADMRFSQILMHNYYALFHEISQVRNAIYQGGLRELVEMRIRSDPQLTAILKILDRHHFTFFEQRMPITRKHDLRATTNDSLFRPEIRRYQNRLLDRYRKPDCAKVLLFLPCSAKKPYSFSKSHKILKKVLSTLDNPQVVHEVIITSPLGLVPRELELMYPASSYDIAVSGIWTESEKKIIRTLLQQYLKKNVYDSHIIHVSKEIQEFIVDLLPHSIITCKNHPLDHDSLKKLEIILKQETANYKKVKRSLRQYQNVKSIAEYQFSSMCSKRLLERCSIRGRYPNLKIFSNNQQLGMITGQRGLISLTLQGGERFDDVKEYWVEIFDDFSLKGSVFAPGVKDAAPTIRVGDDVVIFKNNTIYAVGVAQMNGEEMKEVTYGEAVKVRHRR